MFRVNVDKLVAMNSAKEKNAYDILSDKILKSPKGYRAIAVMGSSETAFKLADTIAENNKVLFIDADFSSSVFMGKYKLGKSLKGICDYLNGTALLEDLLCYTNKDKLDVIFTGDADTHALMEKNETAFKKLIDIYKKQYNYIVLDATQNIDIAKNCDASLLVVDEKDYSVKKAKKEVESLDFQGCMVIGVALNNAK